LANIFVYPLTTPVAGGDTAPEADGATTAIDYVMFQRQRINYKDSQRKYFGRAFPETNTLQLNTDKDRAYIAMPKSLQTQYQPQYKQIDVGVAGVAALTSLGGDLSVETVAQTVSDAAGAALPEFASNTLAEAIGGFNQLLGLGGGLDANSIQALTRGRVFNPFKEQVFQSMAFRTHNFNFKLVSRSEAEARRVRDIINYFKQGATPEVGGAKFNPGEGGGESSGEALSTLFGGETGSKLTSNRFLTVPDSFNIKFTRMAADGSGVISESNNQLHFKIHPSVCSGISVNYTPDGQYTSFKNINGNMIQVPAIDLSLTFTELKLITQQDIAQGF
jgi:hypothetical protein